MEGASYYHCKVVPISRSGGQSSVAASAYRSGGSMYDERTETYHDYSRRSGVLHSELLLPEGALPELAQREKLWNHAEAAESRGNARVAREVRVALPSRLSDEQRVELTRDLSQSLVNCYGVAADFAIHAPDSMGDQRNYHAHIMITTRKVTAEGLGAKTRQLDDLKIGRIEVNNIRSSFSEIINTHLDRHGVDERVDHRSYKDRGIDLTPTIHLGASATALERQGIATRLGDINRAAQKENQEKVLEAVTATRSVFSERDIATELFRKDKDIGEAKSILSRPDIITLLDPSTGDETGLYTTTAIRAREQEVIALATSLSGDYSHGVSNRALLNTLEGMKGSNHPSLDDQQQAAVNYATSKGGLKLIQGRAGTGKSFTLHSIQQIYQADGYNVIGLAPTHAVVQDMKENGFTESRTVASFLWRVDKQETARLKLPFELDKKTVLMVDEAGMLDTNTYSNLLKSADKAGAKVILVGDERQLSSIQRGGMFGALSQKFESHELTSVYRQTGWQKEASEAFAAGKFDKAIKSYEEHGQIIWSQKRQDSIAALVSQWKEDSQANKGTSFVLAYTNAEVADLNSKLQAVRRERGEVGELMPVDTHRGELLVGEGDRIQIRATDNRLGLFNGTLATVEKIDNKTIHVCLDNKKRTAIHTDQFNNITLGYAGTIYRAQGKTLDNTYVLHSKYWRDQSSYVAMTRAREATKLYVAHEDVSGLEQLTNQMSRQSTHGASMQYSTEKEFMKRGLTDLEKEKKEINGLFFPGTEKTQKQEPQQGLFEIPGYETTQKASEVLYQEGQYKDELTEEKLKVIKEREQREQEHNELGNDQK